MSAAKQDFAALTTMRGIGAISVVQLHIGFWITTGWPRGWLFEGFVMWPDYFFLLSGFILMHVYRNSLFAREDSLYNFFVARVARIYPLHVFVLVALIVLEGVRWAAFHLNLTTDGHVFTGSNSPKYIITNLLMIHAWGVQHTDSWNSSAWSISAEFACYLVFPLFIRYQLIERKTRAFLLVAVSAAALIWIQTRYANFNTTYDFGALRALGSFTIGCVLYQYRQSLLKCLAFIPPTLLQLGVVAAVIWAFAADIMPVFYIPLWILLIASLTYEDTPFAKAMSWGPLVQLGEMSYSVYMVHILVLYQLIIAKIFAPSLLEAFISWPPILILLAIEGAVCLLSIFTYRYVENPGRAYIRKRFSRRSKITAKVADAYT